MNVTLSKPIPTTNRIKDFARFCEYGEFTPRIYDEFHTPAIYVEKDQIKSRSEFWNHRAKLCSVLLLWSQVVDTQTKVIADPDIQCVFRMNEQSERTEKVKEETADFIEPPEFSWNTSIKKAIQAARSFSEPLYADS